MDFDSATKLIMALPGVGAEETRQRFADILKRYTGGDASLIDEIHANAQSNSPLAQMARNSIAASTGSSLGNRGAVQALTVDMVGLEIENRIAPVLTMVTTNGTKTAAIEAATKQTVEDVVSIKTDMVDVKRDVATVVNNAKEIATLAEQVKAADLNAKKQEEIAAKVAGGVGAAAAKRYKKVRERSVAAERNVAVLARQQADSNKRLKKLEETLEEVFFCQVEVNASQDEASDNAKEIKKEIKDIKKELKEIKTNQDTLATGQATILRLLMAMKPKP